MDKKKIWLKRSYPLRVMAVMIWILLCFPSIVTAAQVIGPSINENLVLTAEHSPYQTTKDLMVNSGVSLTISQKSNLDIPGSLILKGNLIINPEGTVHIKGNIYTNSNATSYLTEYRSNNQLILDGEIIVDTTKPNIVIEKLKDPIYTVKPSIKVTYDDKETPLDLESLKVILDDNIDITKNVNKNPSGFTYLPNTPLSYGKHKISVTISNIYGLSTTEEWSFEIKQDKSKPVLGDYSPKSTSSTKPLITLNYKDLESGINTNSIKVKLDGLNISNFKLKDQTHLQFIPTKSFKIGTHNFEVSISNNAGLVITKKFSFRITDPASPIIKIINLKQNQVVYNRRIPITFSLTDLHSGINIKTLTVYLDKQRIKSITKTGSSTYKFSPSSALSSGAHTISISITDNSGLSKELKLTFKIATPGFTPNSNELWIEVNQKTQRVYVMKGTKVIREIICSTGRPETPTPNGIFRIQNRGNWFLADGNQVGAKNWVSFKGYGKYMFHSILYDKTGKHIVQSSVRNLGRKASHGCIRLPLNDAQWIYNNIPTNTRVVIFEK